jgi:hypothetical protein
MIDARQPQQTYVFSFTVKTNQPKLVKRWFWSRPRLEYYQSAQRRQVMLTEAEYEALFCAGASAFSAVRKLIGADASNWCVERITNPSPYLACTAAADPALDDNVIIKEQK